MWLFQLAIFQCDNPTLLVAWRAHSSNTNNDNHWKKEKGKTVFSVEKLTRNSKQPQNTKQKVQRRNQTPRTEQNRTGPDRTKPKQTILPMFRSLNRNGWWVIFCFNVFPILAVCFGRWFCRRRHYRLSNINKTTRTAVAANGQLPKGNTNLTTAKKCY